VQEFGARRRSLHASSAAAEAQGRPTRASRTTSARRLLQLLDGEERERRRRAGACDELLRWTKAKGITLPGLVKRREQERELCLADA
jgi:hypothetical protein